MAAGGYGMTNTGVQLFPRMTHDFKGSLFDYCMAFLLRHDISDAFHLRFFHYFSLFFRKIGFPGGGKEGCCGGITSRHDMIVLL